MIREPWEYKYRPKTLDEYIFKDSSHREEIESWLEQGSFPHILLRGHRGTGKTSLAYMLKELFEVNDVDFLKTNASKDNSVNVIRSKISNFVSTMALGKFKIVFLDEADRLTPEAQDALRSLMEEYVQNARFILTCNRPQRIIPELKSRCHEIEYKSLDKDQMLDRAAAILTKEKIKVKSIEIIEEYINTFYPDFRKVVQTLDRNSRTGTLKSLEDSVESDTEFQVKIVEMIETDNYTGLRSALSSIMNDEEWEEAYRFLYENLDQLGKFEGNYETWRQGMILIADHAYRHHLVADPEINAAALFLRLGAL